MSLAFSYRAGGMGYYNWPDLVQRPTLVIMGWAAVGMCKESFPNIKTDI